MGKKFRMTAIALVLLLQSILSPLSVIYAEGAKGIVLNDVQLEDADGNILDAELYPERVIQKDSIFRVKYNWRLPAPGSTKKATCSSFRRTCLQSPSKGSC